MDAKEYVGFLAYIFRKEFTTTYLDQHIMTAIDEILDEFDSPFREIAYLRFGISLDQGKEPERPLRPFGISTRLKLRQRYINRAIADIHDYLEANRKKYVARLTYKLKFKVCNRPDCIMKGKPLSFNYFYSSTTTTTGKRGHCRYCCSKSNPTSDADLSVFLRKPPRSTIPEGKKWCVFHEMIHPYEEFYKCKDIADGYGSNCKEAIRIKRRIDNGVTNMNRKNNKNGAKLTREDARQAIRWLKMGLTPSEITKNFNGKVTRGCISTLKNRPDRWADIKQEEGYVNVPLR